MTIKGLKYTLATLLAFTLITSANSWAAEEISSIARGGILYDKWFKVIKADTPKGAHASYPASGKYRAKKGADWRCKECHGWDYQGKDGAYAKGKHFTGIKGISGQKGAKIQTIVNILTDTTHGFGGMMNQQDLEDLALFVSKGQVDMDRHINRKTKMAKGSKAKGEVYYNTLCAQCHGRDGTMVKDMKAMGKVVSGNPWEALHKMLNGQPGEKMPALRALDRQIAVDILAYTQTLPQKK